MFVVVLKRSSLERLRDEGCVQIDELFDEFGQLIYDWNNLVINDIVIFRIAQENVDFEMSTDSDLEIVDGTAQLKILKVLCCLVTEAFPPRAKTEVKHFEYHEYDTDTGVCWQKAIDDYIELTKNMEEKDDTNRNQLHNIEVD